MRPGVRGGGSHPAGQRPRLQRNVAHAVDEVARRLRPAVLALPLALLGVDRDRLTLEGVQRPAALIEGVRDVLAHVRLIELHELAIGEHPAAADERRVAALDGRIAVPGRVEVGAGGQVVAYTLAVGIQTDVH